MSVSLSAPTCVRLAIENVKTSAVITQNRIHANRAQDVLWSAGNIVGGIVLITCAQSYVSKYVIDLCVTNPVPTNLNVDIPAWGYVEKHALPYVRSAFNPFQNDSANLIADT
eukprot:PhF_6_TR10532/c1_g1_i5/m.16586